MDVQVVNKPEPKNPALKPLTQLCPYEVGVTDRGEYWVGAIGALIRKINGRAQIWDRADSRLKDMRVHLLPDAKATIVIDLGGKSEKEVPTNATIESELERRLENICKKTRWALKRLQAGAVSSAREAVREILDLAGGKIDE